jgi:FMN reductase
MNLIPLIVGIGGTTRAGSASGMALRLALHRAAELGCETLSFSAAGLPGEPFDPYNPHRSHGAQSLVEAMRRADGLLVSTPSYHGSISGLVKNALDYAADLANDEQVYLDGRAVGCIAVAGGAQGLGSTVATLRSIIHALRAWPTPYAAMIDSTSAAFGTDGVSPTEEVRAALARVAEQVVEFAMMKRARVRELRRHEAVNA